MGTEGRDDSRHPSLSRARPVAQSALESFCSGAPGGLPRDEFGPYEVKEVDARTALTHCRIPGEPWSLNPYMGCSHACVYCYVPDVARTERERWGRFVVVKRNLPNLLARELKRREPREVFISSATDPYQPAEHHHAITRRCLEVLVRHDWPVRILTRSPLVVRDLDLLARFSDIQVGLSIPTLDDDARRVLEPHAPPIAGRLATLCRLADAGLPTYANMAPAYPLTGGITPQDIARRFAATGVQVVHHWPWRYMQGVGPELHRVVADTPYAWFEDAVRDEALHARTHADLRTAFAGTGVRFGRQEPEASEGAPWRRAVPRNTKRTHGGVWPPTAPSLPTPSPSTASGFIS